jgi:hypothetical protein
MVRIAAVVVVLMCSLWMGLEAVGRSDQVADSELARRIAGQACAQAQFIAVSNWPKCVSVLDGKWERCDQSQATMGCVAYSGPEEPHCTAVMANCGGTLLSYNNQMDCNTGTNPTIVEACPRQYQGVVSWNNPNADCFPP